jgi:long-chain acyl-CoA synthetase
LTETQIKEWCRERIARYKVPTEIEFRTALPKSSVGKILRRELVREALEKLQKEES